MVTVYVWNFMGSVGAGAAYGHASVKITGGTPAGEIYVSWWPQGRGREYTPVIGEAANLYCVRAIQNRTFNDDMEGEGSPDSPKPPDRIVELSTLDETAMKLWWSNLLGDANSQWCTLSSNCSTVAAQALYNGGGDDQAGDWWTSHNVVWTPNKVFEYASAIQTGAAAAAAAAPSPIDPYGGNLPPGGAP